MRIHKNDKVMVIAGKDKGKTGKVLRAFPREEKVIVDGVNIQKHHNKTDSSTSQGGGIVDVFAPIHVSNVQILDPKTNKPTRIKMERNEGAKKNVRVTKDSGTKLK